MSSIQLTSRLVGMTACNNVATALTAIVIYGGSTL